MKADLRKHTLFLRDGDWDFIDRIFSEKSIPTSIIVRKLVSDYVDQLRTTERAQLPENLDD